MKQARVYRYQYKGLQMVPGMVVSMEDIGVVRRDLKKRYGKKLVKVWEDYTV